MEIVDFEHRLFVPLNFWKTLENAAKHGGTDLHTTKNLFVALFHVLFMFLPFSSCNVYRADVPAVGLTSDFEERFCPLRGLAYFWDSLKLTSIWAHSPEFGKKYAAKLRILVIIGDKGPEVWALVQCCALFFAFRVMYQPDPLHGLGGILGQCVNTDKVYYAVAMGVCYVSRYTRAPFASHKFLKAAQAAVLWFLKYYHLDDPMLADFISGFADDLDMSPERLRTDWAKLRQILREFAHHPAGPRVELRRWLTWTRYTKLVVSVFSFTFPLPSVLSSLLS